MYDTLCPNNRCLYHAQKIYAPKANTTDRRSHDCLFVKFALRCASADCISAKLFNRHFPRQWYQFRTYSLQYVCTLNGILKFLCILHKSTIYKIHYYILIHSVMVYVVFKIPQHIGKFRSFRTRHTFIDNTEGVPFIWSRWCIHKIVRPMNNLYSVVTCASWCMQWPAIACMFSSLTRLTGSKTSASLAFC